MTLKEYLENINVLVKANPKILDYTVVYSSDDEGNNYEEVHYEPTFGIMNEGEWLSLEDDDYEGLSEEDYNAICIN